jgi:hypothetical protein
MRCLLPERLMEDLAGINGSRSRDAAQEHLDACALCCAAVDALETPDTTLVRLLAVTPPVAFGHCPGSEDLACWCLGDSQSTRDSEEIAIHLLGCEACSFAVASLRLEFGSGLEASSSRSQNHPGGLASGVPAASRAPLIAQVIGALVLAILAAPYVVSLFGRLALPHLLPGTIIGSTSATAPADWPLRAQFEFHLKNSSETHTLAFPHYPGVQLSQDYEYSIQLTALRPGVALLFAIDQDHRVNLLIPAEDSLNSILRIEPPQTVRFPVDLTWQKIDPAIGRTRFYAVYFDDVKQAEAFVAESHRSQSAGILKSTLDEMVTAGGCPAGLSPCAVTFQYEVF